jgi:hypothetical protein
MTYNILVAVIFLIPILTMGQNSSIDTLQIEREMMLYKRIFGSADSLTIRGEVGQISSEVIATVKLLDKKRPVSYFEKAAELIEKGQYNDASFLFYVGNLRYRYYNSSNPKYSVSGDGALLTSFHYLLGEPLGYYLRSNADNFIGLLQKSVDWHLTNDYEFYSRKKDPFKYTEQTDKLIGQIADIETNKAAYQETWKQQRLERIVDMDIILHKIKR